MLGMGPWLAIGADEMTLSCFFFWVFFPGWRNICQTACEWSVPFGRAHRGRFCAMGQAVSVLVYG